MSDGLNLILSWFSGIFIGGFFFGGLWWTIRSGVTSKRPALLFFSSLIIRMSITLTSFYFISNGNWKSLISCLIGFVFARLIVTRLTALSEVSHAPQS